MAMTTITVLEPDFYRDFGCVGGACRNNCCRDNWTIFVDKTSYKRLRAARGPKWLCESFGEYICKNQNSSSTDDYAILQKDKNGSCHFQAESGLCRLQAELGADSLCDTCKTYPRYRTMLPEQQAGERGLCCSCEEVARLLLQHPEPILFVQHTEEVPNRLAGPAYRDLTATKGIKNDPMQEHYLAVRAVLIALLQAREYTLDKRMQLVVLLLDKLAELQKNGQAPQTPALLETFVAATQEGLYDELLARDFSLNVSKLFASNGWAYAFSKTGESPILRCCEHGVQQSSYEELLQRYQALLAERGYLVEHLLVTELWNRCIPFHGEYTLEENLCYMVATYAVLRFFLGGYLVGNPQAGDRELVDCIAFFGKEVLHGTANFTKNIELLRRNDMTTLPHLLAIIKG